MSVSSFQVMLEFVNTNLINNSTHNNNCRRRDDFCIWQWQVACNRVGVSCKRMRRAFCALTYDAIMRRPSASDTSFIVSRYVEPLETCAPSVCGLTFECGKGWFQLKHFDSNTSFRQNSPSVCGRPSRWSGQSVRMSRVKLVSFLANKYSFYLFWRLQFPSVGSSCEKYVTCLLLFQLKHHVTF